jgi:quercetin dioxygenase-like cupin family protein
MRDIVVGASILSMLASFAGAQGRGGQAGEARMYASAITDWVTGPDGVARMNLVGDSDSITGLSTFRLRYGARVAKDSSKAVVQFHLGTEHVLVLKGTLVIGLSDSLNYSGVREYTEGGFVVIPSGRRHFIWTRGETEVQVEAVGSTRTMFWGRTMAGRGAGGRGGQARPATAAALDTTPVYPNGTPPWTVNALGGGRMPLVNSSPPSPTELVASRSRFPGPPLVDSTLITYHYHFGTEHITILKGILWFAIGDHLDLSKAKPYGPGSFIENPAGSKHFEWFEGTVEAHIESIGNLGAVNLDPATGQPRQRP